MDLISELAGAVLARNQDTLPIGLDVATKLVEEKQFNPLGLARLDHALTYLLAELDYHGERAEKINDLSSRRAGCAKLAVALRASGHDTPIVEDWLAAASDDPLPDVRHAAGNA